MLGPAAGCCLFVMGGVAMVACGLLIAHPAIETKDFSATTCTVVTSRVSDKEVTCSCGEDCKSWIPCPEVTVTVSGNSVKVIKMYDDATTFAFRKSSGRCSKTLTCSSSESEKQRSAQEYVEAYPPGHVFSCWSNGDDALDDKEFDNMDAFHALFWPGLIVFAGIVMLCSGMACDTDPVDCIGCPCLPCCDSDSDCDLDVDRVCGVCCCDSDSNRGPCQRCLDCTIVPCWDHTMICFVAVYTWLRDALRCRLGRDGQNTPARVSSAASRFSGGYTDRLASRRARRSDSRSSYREQRTAARLASMAGGRDTLPSYTQVVSTQPDELPSYTTAMKFKHVQRLESEV